MWRRLIASSRSRRSGRKTTTQFLRLICLVALFLNVVGVTPLMDGLRDHFDLATRLLLYAPVLTTRNPYLNPICCAYAWFAAACR